VVFLSVLDCFLLNNIIDWHILSTYLFLYLYVDERRSGCFKCSYLVAKVCRVCSWKRWWTVLQWHAEEVDSSLSRLFGWRTFDGYDLCSLPFRSSPVSVNRKNWVGLMFSFLVIILYVSIKSLSRLFLSVVSSKLSVSLLMASFSKFLPIFIALLWTRSRHSISFFRYGDQTCTQYSRWGRMYALYNNLNSSALTYLKLSITKTSWENSHNTSAASWSVSDNSPFCWAAVQLLAWQFVNSSCNRKIS